uniref:Uncharacterized protein LOC102802664 n=1 Tax=Saccoglossus kowalevskii TaxID=10224 RepID=A0ABM0MCQ5_SACKO|nr:PREDICTED: uncharacterized protein LOC102802664 [Saccoglossus kowalevskii]
MAIFVLVTGAVPIDEERVHGVRYCSDHLSNLSYEQKLLKIEKCEHEISKKRAIDGYIILIAVVDIAISLINGCYGIKGICCDGNHGDAERTDDGSKKPVREDRKMGIDAGSVFQKFINAVSFCRPQPVQIYLVLNQTGNGLQGLPLVTNMQGASLPGQNVIFPVNSQGVSMPTSPDMTGVSQNSTDELCTTEKSLLL